MKTYNAPQLCNVTSGLRPSGNITHLWGIIFSVDLGTSRYLYNVLKRICCDSISNYFTRAVIVYILDHFVT